MLQIIHCTNCGKDGALPFYLKWTYDWKWCKYCKNHKDFTKEYHFCSDKCLKEFVNKFAGHKCKYVEQFKGSSYKVCKICWRAKFVVKKVK